MRKSLLALFLLISLSCSPKHVSLQPVAPAPPLKLLPERVEASIGRLTGTLEDRGTYTCTAFAIGPKTYQTAAHCTVYKHKFPSLVLRVDDHIAQVISEDLDLDIAKLLVDLDKPYLVYRTTPLHRFETVHAIGYGDGMKVPTYTDHIVLSIRYDLGYGIAPGIIYQHPFVGGMSGGPVFDENENVVGNVLRANSSIGYGQDAATIMAFNLQEEHSSGTFLLKEMEEEMRSGQHKSLPPLTTLQQIAMLLHLFLG